MSKVDDQMTQTTPAPDGSLPKMPADDLAQARLNYVWDWWKFHAKQRTDMFNYFLIITGILANAYVTLLKDTNDHTAVMIGLGFLGVITSVGFCLLDVRNRRQLERATEILKRIESDQLSDQGRPLGLADIGGSLIFKHKFVFRTTEAIVGLGWLLIILWSFMMG
jgi:hypothetical protein